MTIELTNDEATLLVAFMNKGNAAGGFTLPQSETAMRIVRQIQLKMSQEPPSDENES